MAQFVRRRALNHVVSRSKPGHLLFRFFHFSLFSWNSHWSARAWVFDFNIDWPWICSRRMHVFSKHMFSRNMFSRRMHVFSKHIFSKHVFSEDACFLETCFLGGCMFSRNMFIRICSYLLWPLYLYIWPLYFAYSLRCRLAVVRQVFFPPGLYIDLCNSLDSNSRKVTPCNSLENNCARVVCDFRVRNN